MMGAKFRIDRCDKGERRQKAKMLNGNLKVANDNTISRSKRNFVVGSRKFAATSRKGDFALAA